MISEEMIKQMKEAGMSKPEEIDEGVWNGVSVTLPTVTEGTNTSISAYQEKQSYSMDEFERAGMAVDAMLKLKNGSPFVQDKELIKVPFKAKVLFEETLVKKSIKVMNNGRAEYYSTYGKGVCPDGSSFADKVKYCLAIDPKAFIYPSLDLVFIAEEDLKASDGSIAVAKGTKLGYTTSATNKKNVSDFYTACKAKSIDTSKDEVLIQIGFESKKNTKGNVWTVLTFNLI